MNSTPCSKPAHAFVHTVEMDPTRLGKSIKCVLRCTDDVIDAFTAAETEVTRSVDAYRKHFAELNDDFASPPSSEPGRRASFAKAWLEAVVKVKLFKQLQPMLGVVRERASLIATSGSMSAARCNACHVVWYGGKTACTLLHHACLMVSTLLKDSNSALHTQAAKAVLAAMAEAGFMSAVSGAVRGIVATAAFLRSDAGVRELSSPTFDLRDASIRNDELAGLSAYMVCQYLRTLTEALHNRLIDLGGGRNPQASVRIPSEALQAFGALADSQLLAAAALALVDSPPVDAIATLPEEQRNAIGFYVGHATAAAAKSMCDMLALQKKLAEVGGAEGRRLSAGLGRVMQHEAVRRLQVALLDQLAAHAGMGAGLEEWEGGSGLQEGGDGGRQARGCGWEGSSGTWWLAREEAAQGKLLGLDLHGGGGSPEVGQETRSKTAGWLEGHHKNILRVTVQEWGSGDPGEAGAAGVPAAPPPLLLARLTARAAEALCRLCRGQGLDGTYAPAPEWQFAWSQDSVLKMLPTMTSRSAATARACVPYWLESTGWLAALMSDATAAAMGRLPSAGRPDAPRSMPSCSVQVQDKGSPYGTLDKVVGYLTCLVYEHTNDFKELDDDDARDTLCRRVARCGLAAAMDHTLRLTYTAQDVGDTQVGPTLTQSWVTAVSSGLAPLLPPTNGHGSGASQAEGGGSTGGGGGGQGRAELGVVLTLSKRAAMLTRALEAEAGAGAAGAGKRGQGQGGQQVVDWAADVLSLLAGVAHSMERDVRKRVEAAGREAAAASGAGGGSDAAWREDAVCLDEVQEALAQAARALSNLAVALAWRLAVDVSSRRTAAREAAAEGPAVQLSVTEEMAPHTVCDVLSNAMQCWRHLLLPPAQLLACQPHRLLAAACALMDALPEYHVFNSYNHEETRDRLSLLVPGLLAFMSAHETLSGRVRAWLAPPPAAAAAAAGAGSSTCGGSGSSGSEAEAEACAGCLEAPVRSLARRALRFAPTFALHAMALLKIAAGQVGGTARRTGTDGGFRQFAAEMAERVWEAFKDPTLRSFEQVPMPDGSLPSHMLAWEQFAAGSLRLPVAPSGAPPPPLALPPCRQGALPRLRVCGNPHCGNFAEESEGWLPLKQCGGCRAVRYCCADCQRAHWRAGHKAECKLIAAADGE